MATDSVEAAVPSRIVPSPMASLTVTPVSDGVPRVAITVSSPSTTVSVLVTSVSVPVVLFAGIVTFATDV